MVRNIVMAKDLVISFIIFLLIIFLIGFFCYLLFKEPSNAREFCESRGYKYNHRIGLADGDSCSKIENETLIVRNIIICKWANSETKQNTYCWKEVKG